MLRDPAVQELLDRSRIGDTIYAWCDYVDRTDIDAVLDLFTEDAQMDLGGGAIHRGHAELREMLLDRFALYSTTSFHCSAVRLVRYDGVTASTTTYLNAFHDARHTDRRMHLWGRYEDDMVNDAGMWKFHRRRLRVAGLSHAPVHEVPPRFNRVGRDPVPEQRPREPALADSGRVLRGPEHWSRVKR